MRVLIVGAGAVGQVYGLALQRGGAEVGFLVKPKHASEARAGFTLYDLNRRDPHLPIHFEADAVLDGLDAVADSRWDLVMPAVSGPALRGGWLGETMAAAPHAGLALLHAGMADAQELAEVAAPGRPLLRGLIPFMAYHAPMPGESVPVPGTAWWMPPLTSAGFTGPAEHTQTLVDTLNAGGLRASVDPSVARAGAFGTVFLSLHMAALELSGWRFEGLRQGPWLDVASQAVGQAASVVEQETGLTRPGAFGIVGPTAVRLLTRVIGWVTPHDAESFFRVHFTKVGHQTRDHLGHWVASGREQGLPVEAIATLATSLDA